MEIDSPVNLPIDDTAPIGDKAIQLFTDLTTASLTGDTEKLRTAVEEWVALAPERRLEFEQLISMVMPPWILPMQMFEIFSDPEQFVGAFSRLGGSEGAAVATAMADTTASSIVLAAVANWLQNEQDIALVAKKEVKTEKASNENASGEKTTTATTTIAESPETTAEGETTQVSASSSSVGGKAAVSSTEGKATVSSTEGKADESVGVASPVSHPTASIATSAASTQVAVASTQAAPIVLGGESEPTVAATSVRSDNPINAALAAYINTGGTGGPVDAAQSMQFLRNNPILLSGLQTVDPALLVKAYQIAEAEIVVGLLDKIIEMQAQIRDEQKRYEEMKERQEPSPTQNLLSTIHQGVHDKSIPLNQSTLMVIQLLLMNAAVMQVGGMAAATGVAPAVSSVEGIANLTAITSTQAGLGIAKVYFPNDAVATSVLVSIPNVFANDRQQITSPEALIQMGLLASIYAQMVPYWSIPAAVSFQAAENAKGNGQKAITESAVRAFAVAVGTMINDPAFTLLIQSIILNNSPDPTKVTPDQLKAYTAALKIALLANAIVALYVVILKKSPEEIAQLLGIPIEEALDLRFNPQKLVDMILYMILDKNARLPKDPLLHGLIRQIQEQLKELPELNRNDFIKNLFGSYSEGFSVEDLVNPSTQFLRLCDQTLFHEHTTETSV